jgi:hypothetical protein
MGCVQTPDSEIWTPDWLATTSCRGRVTEMRLLSHVTDKLHSFQQKTEEVKNLRPNRRAVPIRGR